MKKKYKTEPDLGTGLLRVIALRDFSNVKKGEKGGLIEKEDNLSHEGDCWIYDGAKIYENAKVWENARICGKAQVWGNAEVYGDAQVLGHAEVSEGAKICGEAHVCDNARVYGNTGVYGEAWIWGDAEVFGGACVSDNAKVFGKAQVYGSALVCGNARIEGNVRICGDAEVYAGYDPAAEEVKISGNAKLYSTETCIIANSIEDSRDCIILACGRKRRLRVVSLSYISKYITEYKEYYYSTLEKNYIKNIQTIRQLYGEEI